MRAFSRFAAALLLVLGSAAPALAGMAMIETAAPLNEHSNEGVKTAVVTAVQTAVRGAQAMGLPRVALNGVRVLPGMVVVRILATDSASESAPEWGDQHNQPDQNQPEQNQPDQNIEPGLLGLGEADGFHVEKY